MLGSRFYATFCWTLLELAKAPTVGGISCPSTFLVLIVHVIV